MKSTVIQVDQKPIRIKYVEEGTGPTLVFFHNGCTGSFIWREQIAHFSKNHRVVAPDLPGFAGSDRPSGSYTLERLTEWCAQFLGAVAPEPKWIVGNCIGSAIALELAKQESQKVQGLILFNICGGLRAMNRINRWFYRMGAHRVLGTLVLRFKRLERVSFQEMFHDVDRVHPTVLNEFRKLMNQEQQKISRDRMVKGLPSFDRVLKPGYGGMDHLPIKIIWSENNRVVPNRFSKHLSPALIKEAGHIVMLEKPEESNLLIQNFLEEFEKSGHC